MYVEVEIFPFEVRQLTAQGVDVRVLPSAHQRPRDGIDHEVVGVVGGADEAEDDPPFAPGGAL